MVEAKVESISRLVEKEMAFGVIDVAQIGKWAFGCQPGLPG